MNLSPDEVDCIVFWTKNPKPFLPHLKELEDLGYSFYFQFSLTAYDHHIEKNLPPKEQLVENFQQLAQLVGPQRVIWRYDPILLSEQFSIADHYRHFEHLAAKLEGSTNSCMISFLDLYAKTRRNTQALGLHSISQRDMEALGRGLADIGRRYGHQLLTCAESIDLGQFGIKPGSCIDQKRIERIIDARLAVNKDKNQREACGCVESIDIGPYNTCSNNCLYCYANVSQRAVANHVQQHDPQSPLLFGHLGDEDQLTIRKMHPKEDS